MKSSRLSEIERLDRRRHIMNKRFETIRTFTGPSYIQYKTTRKVYGKSRSFFGKEIVAITHDQRPYPHSSSRQQARYARQQERRLISESEFAEAIFSTVMSAN